MKSIIEIAVLLSRVVATTYVLLGYCSPATASPNDRCDALASTVLDQVEIEVASTQRAGATIPGAMIPDSTGQGTDTPIAGLPAFCRVTGHIHPEPGSDIRFEIWMPSAGWQGGFTGVGNGGFAGPINYADLAGAVKAGRAAVSTDTGHGGNGIDSSWANGHPERVRDYGWRAVHLSTLAGKQLVAKYYGRQPVHPVFMSCSNGGRQGLMEASRFPEDYDGVMAGAPAAEFSEMAMSMLWAVRVQLPSGAAIRPEQAVLLQSEVIKQCDALDGQLDGLIADPRNCKIDLSKLACGAAASPQCFTPNQLGALKNIYAGPHDAAGNKVVPAFLPGGAEGIGSGGWGGWIFARESFPAIDSFFPAGLLKDFVAKPFADIASFDFDKDPARLRAAVGPDLDVQPNLRHFFDRGGKLILWHGWADAAIVPEATLEFYQAVLRASGDRAKDSMRLFMVPGLQHCFGGAGPTNFGQTGVPSPSETPERNISAALQAWVEKGRVPERVVVRKEVTATQAASERLLCSWPARAELQPGGDPEKSFSYKCRRQ
jgi:Tannase and feruloyl esterase